MATRTALSRRRFLKISAIAGAAGTSLLIGCSAMPEATQRPTTPTPPQPPAPQPTAAPPTTPLPAGSLAPSVWLKIDPDDTITILVGKSEMGQGVRTALPMLVAEELDADWSRIRVEQAPAGNQYGNQATGGSTSMSEAFVPLRNAGAAARMMLLAAAAQVWKVDQASCRTESGAVIHTPSGRRLAYGALAGTAATLKPPALSAIRLKPAGEFRLIGTRAPRLDTPAIVDGSAVFGLDVRLPGMLYATVARCPVPGGSATAFDGAKARAVPGVRQVLQIPSGVAVVADTTWAALQGRAALEITWQDGPNAGLDSDKIRQLMQRGADQKAAGIKPVAGAARTIEAAYELPHQAHATMEPMNCTADVHGGRCDIWAPTQDPPGARMMAAAETGLALDAIAVHTTLMGGGFGRRGQHDFVVEAVQISKALAAPVQVVWSREDDMRHDFYRPRSHHRMSADLDAAGRPLSWRHTVAAESIGFNIAHGAELRYPIPNRRTSAAVAESGVPVGAWRSVAFSYNVFAVECFLDEIAAAGGADPYELRRQLLAKDTQLRAALELAAGKAGWGAPLPPGHGRGIALCAYERTNVAQVAEVAVSASGAVRVDRVVCAIDCGLVVHPDIVAAQVESAIVYGLTAALKSEITIDKGRVVQGNFDGFPLLRLDEMPQVEVYTVPSTAAPSGVGEVGVPPVAAALANAIYAATGKRVRRLPIRAEDLRA